MTRHILILIFSIFSQNVFSQIDFLKEVTDKANQLIKSEENITPKQASQGLIDALTQSSNYAIKIASSKNGFYSNKLIFIPFPQEAKDVRHTLLRLGMRKEVKEFEKSINYAAELASKTSKEIINDAIKAINISDAFSIINGKENAATEYLREQTYKILFQRFEPIVKDAIISADVARYWAYLIKYYNSVPFTKPISISLEEYVTVNTLEGLFVLIAKEEANIRNNMEYRTTPLMQKIFK